MSTAPSWPWPADALPAVLDPRGRAARAEFWIGLFVHFELLRLLGVDRWIAAARHGLPPQFGGWVATTLTLLELWLIVVLISRRWHDVGYRLPWWPLIGVPFAGWLFVFVVLGFVPGAPGRNRWGPPPTAGDGMLGLLRRLAAASRGLTPRKIAPDAATPTAEPAPRSESWMPAPPAAMPPASGTPTAPIGRARRPAPAAPKSSAVILRAAPRLSVPKPVPVIVRPRRLF